jgi:hypothetical protein
MWLFKGAKLRRRRTRIHQDHEHPAAMLISPICFLDVSESALASTIKMHYDVENQAIMLHCTPMYDSIKEVLEELEANNLKF